LTQAPPSQPFEQGTSCAAYVHAPAVQVPGDTKECRVVAALQTGAGGTSQAAQATPLRPQRVALCVEGFTHVPELLQQPSGQLVASHTQAPLEQR
jgi:hypothetical protein